eukprot:CAMPEP_0194577340 /NCGR_PEP_ID=MMETSP0292-20121207/12158_1 /TAXON_ID=39354 /ORGANISM="Heterosigma akashiwo, Strain CCMP2393" /LENGTH=136 /DNA_ID=CAMNT_0039429697 /DNA_START=9 /DNA_END=419 /DNA_ORIENTATION=+
MKVFTYGTLLQGQCRGHVLGTEHFLGKATTKPLYQMYHIEGAGDVGYPALVECQDGGYCVHGEIYEISASKLLELDAIEGEPWLYRRKTIELQENEPIYGYIYQQDVSGKLEIKGGCWRSFVEEGVFGNESVEPQT